MSDLSNPNTTAMIDPDDLENNPSANPSIHDVLKEHKLSRRAMLKSGVGAMTVAGLGVGVTACGGGNDPPPAAPASRLAFAAVPKVINDRVTVPAGYTATVLYATGDSIDPTVPVYTDDGNNSNFARRSGDHHDGMQYFGLSADGASQDPNSNDRALLVMNHENIAGTVAFLHPAGQTNPTSGARPEAEAIRELEAHGVSVIEIRRTGTTFTLNRASTYNRRITARTPMEINGPVRGTAFVQTAFSPTGTMTRGTINNCANGYTPWGTYITCEENWAFYFARNAGDDALRTASEVTALGRIGVRLATGTSTIAGNNRWTTATSTGDATEFSRWNTSVTGASATVDFRNAINTFGWVVEIDPFQPSSTPRKRTAMGRFAHEGAWPSNPVVGQPLAFYMGDDSRGEYVYKFVSTNTWRTSDFNGGLTAGDRYLDSGILYAARFNADGTGTWLPLNLANPLISGATNYTFTSEADILVNARLAADAAGATKMDRPEWTAVNPTNGEIYVTMTENPERGGGGSNGNNNPIPGLDAANPRYWADVKGITTQNPAVQNNRGNINGHIVRMRETGNLAAATTFSWDIYLFGAQAQADTGGDNTNYQANVNLSGLDDTNDLSKPDGCWFSRASGILWIETDDNTYTDGTNSMLLAAIPGTVGDGGPVTVTNLPAGAPTSANPAPTGNVAVTTRMGQRPGVNLRRFLTAPTGAEVTGLTESPDGRVLFINIQHPGENSFTAPTSATFANPASFESHWPGNGGGVAAYGPGGATARPRSATVMITKNDGGIIGL